MLNKFLLIFLLIPFSYGFSQNSFPLFSSGSYSGGSGDHTNVNNAQLKLQSLSGTYIRVPHVSSHSSVSTVFNFESAKSVYWGEPTDVGKYFFRGRDLVIENGKLGIGTATGPNFNLDITTVGDFQGIQMYHNTGKWLRFFSSLPAGSYNGITKQNDAGIIFGQDGVLGHGFVIAPHRSLTSGIRIDENGRVGVGTHSLGPQLAVFSSSQEVLSVESSSHSILDIKSGAGLNSYLRFVNNGANKWDMAAETGGNLRIYDYGSASTRMVLTPQGRLGIGTTSPQTTLEVNGCVSASYGKTVILGTGSRPYYLAGQLPLSSAGTFHKLKVQVLGGGWHNSTVGETTYYLSSRDGLAVNQETRGGAAGKFAIKIFLAGDHYDVFVQVTEDFPCFTVRSWAIDGNAGLHEMPIIETSPVGSDVTPTVNLIQATSSNGNVGIGIANPQQKLHVKGTVYSTEVKVDVAAGSGPDYVFADNYQLPTLTEVKSYIDQHKHLPEVPSAKEMEANGVNLGEMNLLLLKKIEELTLYLLNQEEQIGEMKRKLLEQEKQIEKLIKRSTNAR